MKYRHAHHAANFADVHKHVTLLALIDALQRKEKGFLYLETHAGRGLYDVAGSAEAAGGLGRLEAAAPDSPELRSYLDAVRAWRGHLGRLRSYPGSPLLALMRLRAQDRAVLVEREPGEARALERSVAAAGSLAVCRVRTECDDGYARLRAHLPPAERRALLLIDPPYEDTRGETERVAGALGDAQRRLSGGVAAVWYPIKEGHEAARRLRGWLQALASAALIAEIWPWPRDSRVALNGSGLLIANPPFGLQERMQSWLPELARRLDASGHGGWALRPVPPPAVTRAQPRGRIRR